jgi:hypothetical protein
MVLLFSRVGPGCSSQQTPTYKITPAPSEVTLPPLIAEESVMAETVSVLRLGSKVLVGVVVGVVGTVGVGTTGVGVGAGSGSFSFFLQLLNKKAATAKSRSVRV